MRIELRSALGKVIEAHDLQGHETLADNLMRIWPAGHPGFTSILQDADGVIIGPDRAVEECPGGDYHLVLLPLGPAILGIPLGMWVLLAVSIAATIILTPSQPSVTTQNYEWEDGESNFAANQTNKIRPGARVPDVFGKMRVYPDLIAEPYSRYFGRDQKLFELFVVSNGDCEITRARLHADDVEENYDATIEVIKPGEKIPARFRVVTPNRTVTQLELPAENESYTSPIGIDFNTAGTISADEYIWQKAWETKLIYVTDCVDANNEGVYTVTARSGDEDSSAPYSITVDPVPGTTRNDDGSAVYYALGDTKYTAPRAVEDRLEEIVPTGAAEPAWWTPLGKGSLILADRSGVYSQHTIKNAYLIRNNPATNTIGYNHDIYYALIQGAAPGGGADDLDYWILTDATATEPDADAGGFRNWSAWYATPNDDAVDLWFDVSFPKGLYRQNAGEIPREREVQIAYQWREQGSATVFSGTKTFSEKTRNQLRYSERERDLTPGKYEMRWRRVTDFEAETATKLTIDECIVSRFAGARQPTDRTLKNCTAVFLELSTQLNNIEGTRKFNCIASRKLPSYQPLADSTVLVESNKIADAVAYTLIEQAGYDQAQIDLAGLYDLFGGNGLDFRGVIDQEMSADDQIALLLSAGNGYAYRRAGVIHFVRDRKQTIPRTLFNRRNKVEPERKSMTFGQTDDPDAVEVTYFDQDDDYKQNVVTYPENITPLRPKKITLIGKTQYPKAWRRAKREYDLIRYRKDTLNLTVTEEGALLAPNDMIAVTDHLRATTVIDGELVSHSGKTLIVDVDASAAQAGDMIRLRDKYGAAVQQTTVVSADGNSVVIAENVTVEASANEQAQTGILFSIINDDDSPKELWLVQQIKAAQSGAVNLECVNYSDRVYDADTATPPSAPNEESEPE